MRKHIKKIAVSVVLSMAVALLAPASQVAMAAKTFTYAEQNSGDEVTVLAMDPGEKVDLKFYGVPDYKNYKAKWVSSNESVAVVDSTGLITAVGKGTATIKLILGDGKDYTSAGVTVYVGLKQTVTIGTTTEDEIKSYVLEKGKKVTLKPHGLRDMVGDRYSFTWSSTDTSVAKISTAGVVTAVNPGLTVIQLTVTKVATGEKMEANPIALRVSGTGEVVPTTAPTPTPTRAPYATATPIPTPTQIPYVSPTVTPVPSDKYVPYTAILETDSCLLLKFSQKVSYDVSDVKLYHLITAGNSVYEVRMEVTDAKLSRDGLELRITPDSMFQNGQRYIVRVGDADVTGTTVNVSLGAPNRIEITYSCLGKEGVAYAYNDQLTIDVPVTLDYRLYYGTVDVTDTYNTGYVTFDFTNSKYAENASLSGNTLSFYDPNVSVVLNATYSYYDDNYRLKELKSGSVVIRSQKIPDYAVTGVVDWTIVESSATSVDWDNKVNKIIANTGNYKLVVKLADNYGNFYTNDMRAVDEANNIYSTEDYNHLFSQFGYSVEFKAADPNQIILNTDGSLYPFKAATSAAAIVTLTNNGTNGITNYSRNIGACPISVLAESKLTAVSVENSRVTLASAALPGYENRFCMADVEILLKDQYGGAWNGSYNLELSSTVSEINSALGGNSASPAWLEGNVLRVSAANIKSVTNRTTFPLLITETTTNRKVTVNVVLQTPTTSNGSITTSGWSLGLDNSSIVIGDEAMQNLRQSASIEVYKMSSNGVRVGLYNSLYVIDTNNYRFTTTNCNVGDVYIYVSGPNGKPVPIAGHNGEVGVYVDHATSTVKVNVFATGTNSGVMLESLPEGNYTVRATRIVNIGTNVQTAVQTATFSVKDETKEVTFRAIKSTKTPLTLNSDTDLAGVKAIVASVLSFNLDGEEWTTLTEDMVADVEYVVNGRTLVVRSVTLAVPIYGASGAYGLSYCKVVPGINKAITTGVNN